MSQVFQKFQSSQNRDMVLKIIGDVSRQKYQIVLDGAFKSIFNDIVQWVSKNYSHKPNNSSEDQYLNTLNKIAIDQAIKYIGDNLSHFTKLPNSESQSTDQSVSPSIPTAMESSSSSATYASPIMGDNKLSERDLLNLMEQRRQDAQSNRLPYHEVPDKSRTPSNQSLMTILLQTPMALQTPQLIPQLMNEILGIPHLVDLMNNDIEAFKKQISNPTFLQMLSSNVSNKNNQNLKPMDLNEPTPKETNNIKVDGNVTNDFYQRLNMYQDPNQIGQGQPGTGQGQLGTGQLGTGQPGTTELFDKHVLPTMDGIHLIDYDLSLDFRIDLESIQNYQYILKFNQYGNLSKIRLVSVLIQENDHLKTEPYIFLKLDELGGRCYTASRELTFGKLIVSKCENGFINYRPDEESCVQLFSEPITLNKLTISFLDYRGQPINLKEIQLTKVLKLNRQNKIKFITQFRHQLKINEEIEIQIIRQHEIDSYSIKVETIVDGNTFLVDNVFETLTDNIKILRRSVQCSLRFKLYEINWNLLNHQTPQTIQLIKLAQLVNETKTLKSLPSFRPINSQRKDNDPI